MSSFERLDRLLFALLMPLTHPSLHSLFSLQLVDARAFNEQLTRQGSPFQHEFANERRRKEQRAQEQKQYLSYSGDVFKLAAGYIGVVEYERDVWKDTALALAKEKYHLEKALKELASQHQTLEKAVKRHSVAAGVYETLFLVVFLLSFPFLCFLTLCS